MEECEECGKKCEKRTMMNIIYPRVPEGMDIKTVDPSLIKNEPMQLLLCDECWNKYDLMYKKNLDFVVHTAENLLAKAGDQIDDETKNKLKKIIRDRGGSIQE